MARIKRWLMVLPILHKILIINSFILLIGAALGIAMTEKVMEEGRFTAITYLVMVGTTILFGTLLNYLILKMAFRPLEALQAVVKQVHAGNLRARAVLDRASDPDIGHFAVALNTMLERMEANARTIEEDKRQLQRLAAQVITAQEDERKRVARELHDEASQALTTLIIGLETALESMPPRLTGPRQQVIALRTLTEQTLDEIRNLALSLRPTVLDDLGLASAVRWYAKTMAEKANLQVRLDAINMEDRMPAAVETAVFRIVQEGLANVARHAAATEVQVRLERTDHTVSLVIADNGQGFDAAAALSPTGRGAGLGLFGIEERVTVLGGKWELSSEPGRGTTLKVWIPLEGQESEGEKRGTV